MQLNLFEQRNVRVLKAAHRNARTYSAKQIRQIADSIDTFGFVNPVLVDADDRIVAGHGRVDAARKLGLATVPVICLEHLSEAELRAYAIADNRLAELLLVHRRCSEPMFGISDAVAHEHLMVHGTPGRTSPGEPLSGFS